MKKYLPILLVLACFIVNDALARGGFSAPSRSSSYSAPSRSYSAPSRSSPSAPSRSYTAPSRSSSPSPSAPKYTAPSKSASSPSSPSPSSPSPSSPSTYVPQTVIVQQPNNQWGFWHYFMFWEFFLKPHQQQPVSRGSLVGPPVATSTGTTATANQSTMPDNPELDPEHWRCHGGGCTKRTCERIK